MANYLSGTVQNLQVGVEGHSEDHDSLTVIGNLVLGTQRIGGGQTAFTVDGNIGVGTDTPTDAVGASNTSVLAAGIITAYKYYGDGSSLTGISAAALQDTNGAIRVQANTSGAVITGVATATTYNGDLVIGTPSGGFKSGAFTINNTDKTKDSINDLNNILGKLVPSAPTTINGVSISLTGTAGSGRLCAGFTPTNNTGGSAPSAGTQYTRNTDSTVSTTYITEYGPGDSETVEGFVNAIGIGTVTLATGDNSGTYGAIQLSLIHI